MRPTTVGLCHPNGLPASVGTDAGIVRLIDSSSSFGSSAGFAADDLGRGLGRVCANLLLAARERLKERAQVLPAVPGLFFAHDQDQVLVASARRASSTGITVGWRWSMRSWTAS